MTLKEALSDLQMEMKELVDKKDKAMNMKLMDIQKQNSEKMTVITEKMEIQGKIQKLKDDEKERRVDDASRQQWKGESNRLHDKLNHLNDELVKIDKSIMTARQAKKESSENFMKLEEELASKDIALRKAISALVFEEKLKKETKDQKSCNSKLNSWLYKLLTCKVSSLPDKKKNEPKIVEKMRKYLGRDFSDVLSAISFAHQCPSGMGRFRFLAFIFGILPELASLLFMAVAGVQYILWSGFKVDSDTQGMEEIILATLAINFIYEIDDAVYDHVLPELYKEAHERDRFEITGFWISSESSAILDKCQGASSSSRWFSCCSDRKGSHELGMEKQDGLRMLSKCEPLKWETESKPQNHVIETEHKKETDKVNENEKMQHLEAPCSAVLGFPCCTVCVDKLENQVEENLPRGNTAHVRSSGIREVQ